MLGFLLIGYTFYSFNNLIKEFSYLLNIPICGVSFIMSTFLMELI